MLSVVKVSLTTFDEARPPATCDTTPPGPVSPTECDVIQPARLGLP